jgi:lipoprotein-anchoring transpeptidase ErfK/SrfK
MRSALAGAALAVLIAAAAVQAEETQHPDGAAVLMPAAATAGKRAETDQQTDPGPVPTAPIVTASLQALPTPGPALVELPPPPAPPPVTLVLKADLSAQRLTVIQRGKVLHSWAISSGRAGFATATGNFRPQWASKMWYSRQYELAPMPHAVFFNRGTAFHGTGAVSLLGRPASHGCVRLHPSNAKALYSLVHRHGYASTKIVVFGAPSKKNAPAVAARQGKPKAQKVAGVRNRAAGRVSPYGPRPTTQQVWGFGLFN